MKTKKLVRSQQPRSENEFCRTNETAAGKEKGIVKNLLLWILRLVYYVSRVYTPPRSKKQMNILLARDVAKQNSGGEGVKMKNILTKTSKFTNFLL